MKKIAFIIPDLYTGGMPRVLENLSSFLPQDKFEQTIILLKDKPVNFKVQGRVVPLVKEGKNYLEKGIVFLKRIWKLYWLCKKEKYDVLIGVGMTANIISILIHSTAKVIATEHNVKSIENHVGGGFVKTCVNMAYDFLIRMTYNHSAAVVPVSRIIGEDLIRTYHILPNKIHVIYNGVDETTIREKAGIPLPDEEKFLFDDPVIINVGALSKQKGQWHLIRIMPELIKRFPRIKLILLGTGDYGSYLEQLINDYGLQKYVKLLGVKENPYQYVQKATVFALSSLYEGFPNVLVEAIMLGCPVVSVDCMSGPRELLLDEGEQAHLLERDGRYQGKYGVLCKPFSEDESTLSKDLTLEEQSLLAALHEMLSDQKLQKYYAKAGRLRSEQFDASGMAKEYEKLIDEICRS